VIVLRLALSGFCSIVSDEFPIFHVPIRGMACTTALQGEAANGLQKDT